MKIQVEIVDKRGAEVRPLLVEILSKLNLVIMTQRNDTVTPQQLEALKKTVSDNTNAVQSATMALTGYAQSTAELTSKLQAALAAADATDDLAVQDAIAALAKNNTDLVAAVPAVAAAVVANTSAG